MLCIYMIEYNDFIRNKLLIIYKYINFLVLFEVWKIIYVNALYMYVLIIWVNFKFVCLSNVGFIYMFFIDCVEF